MAVRKATAVWHGTLVQGKGVLGVESRLFTEARYGYGSRFEDGEGTNPEELLGAAYAGCFSQALAMDLEQAGYPPERIETTCEVTLSKTDEGFRIERAALETRVRVEAIDNRQLQRLAEGARDNCPVSRALAGVEKSVESIMVR